MQLVSLYYWTWRGIATSNFTVYIKNKATLRQQKENKINLNLDKLCIDAGTRRRMREDSGQREKRPISLARVHKYNFYHINTFWLCSRSGKECDIFLVLCVLQLWSAKYETVIWSTLKKKNQFTFCKFVWNVSCVWTIYQVRKKCSYQIPRNQILFCMNRLYAMNNQ